MTANALLAMIAAEEAKADPLQLYKLASTIFLGIGIAAVLQGRLVARQPDFPISDRARGIWATVDVVAAFAMLTLIAVGEITALKVLQAGQAGTGNHTLTVVLLACTAAYVVVAAAIQRALAFVWAEPANPEDQPILDGGLVRSYCLAVGGGLILGGSIMAGVAFGLSVLPLLVPLAVGAITALVGTRRVQIEITSLGPMYRPSPVPLEDVVGTWHGARLTHGFSLAGGTLVLTRKFLVFSPWNLSRTFRWLNESSRSGESRSSDDLFHEDPLEAVAVPVGNIVKAEVLNRASLRRPLRPPTARLHLRDGRYVDVGVVASPTSANFSRANNRVFEEFLDKLPVPIGG